MAKMNKEQLNVSVSTNTKMIAEEYGSSNEFSSISNFVESAILYYKGALDRDIEAELIECRKELQKVIKEAGHDRDILLKLLTEHKELTAEVNNMSSK